MTDQTQAGRRQFLLLAALFAAPLIAAFLLYFVWPELQPKGRTNYGELVAPARPVPALRLNGADGKPAGADTLEGKWSFVYLGGAQCDQSCQDKLFQIRQIRILLNQDRDRVQRVYLAPDAVALQAAREVLSPIHTDLLYVAEAGPAGQRASDFFLPREKDAVYLLDPLGNWLMVYPASAEYKGILKDVKRLLKLSHIG